MNVREQKEQTIRLNFRSDKAFMSLAEIEEKDRASKALQADLMQQILEKKQKQVLSSILFEAALQFETKGL